MSTAVLERPKKRTGTKTSDPQESLKREIRFWLKRIDNDEFLKGIRTLVRSEAIVKRVAHFDSLPLPVRQAILDCDRDIAADRLYSSEEVFQEIDEWLEKS